MSTFFSSKFIQFFKELETNNNKEWFHSQKKTYETEVKKPFHSFIDELILRVNADDPSVTLSAKEAIFRINRDIRFSKDKTPYKTHMAAIVSPGGRKDKTIPGLYLQLGAEDFRIYSGAYMPDKDGLYQIRSYMCQHIDPLNKLINDPAFKKTFGQIQGEKNKRIPSEFNEFTDQQPLLFNKSFYIFVKLKPETIQQDDLMEVVLRHYQLAKPFMQYFRAALNYS